MPRETSSSYGARRTRPWPLSRLATRPRLAPGARRTRSQPRALFPQVVVDEAGNATAVWFGSPNGQLSTIFSSTYSASGDTWSPPDAISTATFGPRPGLAVDDSGVVTAVWGVHDGSFRTTRYTARRVSGQPWAAPVTLDETYPSSGVATSFAAASASGDVTVLWSDFGARAGRRAAQKRCRRPLRSP